MSEDLDAMAALVTFLGLPDRLVAQTTQVQAVRQGGQPR
jgi:hypothetical protein